MPLTSPDDVYFEGRSFKELERAFHEAVGDGVERGEIALPHNETMFRIAEALDLRPDALETF